MDIKEILTDILLFGLIGLLIVLMMVL